MSKSPVCRDLISAQYKRIFIFKVELRDDCTVSKDIITPKINGADIAPNCTALPSRETKQLISLGATNPPPFRAGRLTLLCLLRAEPLPDAALHCNCSTC